MSENFSLEGEASFKLSAQNKPAYMHKVNNFQEFMVNLDRKNWQSAVEVTSKNYTSSQPNQGLVTTASFSNIDNMQHFVERTADQFRNTNLERIQSLKTKINNLINELYENVVMSAFQYEQHRVPIHGIPEPQYENPVNLFQRQLQIEQYSFDQSHQRYKNQVADLIKLGKADQLASSHRNILKWTRTMEAALAE